MGQLAQRMEKSTNFFSSDTIPNPQEECKAIYLRNGKVVREEKEETKESSDKQGKEATEDIIQQEEHVTPTILFVDRKYEEALFQYELALQVALNMSSSVEVHMKRILEIDPSNDQARKGICRLEPLAAEKREKMKEEMMDKIVHGHAFRLVVYESYYLKNLRKRGLLQLFRLQRWKLCILMHIRVFINMGVFGVYQGVIGGGKTVKAKIKSVKSKDEGESLKFTHKNLIDKICTDSADAKIPAVLEYLGTFIEAGFKFLIFAHHQPMIDAIHECLLTCCIKATIGYRFPGRGLYQGSCVIFAELSWTPGYLFQAEDRAHRIGKVSPVNIYYLLANDTVDDIIWDVVQFKLDNLGLMLDGHENTLAVSNNQPLSSPAKHTTIEHSPLRQRTLDQFVRRCDNADRSEHQPDPKRPC
ncbi:hypothetical protein Ahy_A01g000651 isoform D [Arachis hypogaea]|uniref:Helicase C-terminal domain-containing protein n=1 Tax=Arachis hypogaea TaxID=3818 RepID=A0A445EKS8_ARAHY|nr:hypothetical protein Ahy_A01g000651 isoform D [Arachis hypogaea]